MHASVKKHVWIMGMFALACTRGELTGPVTGGATRTTSTAPDSLVAVERPVASVTVTAPSTTLMQGATIQAVAVLTDTVGDLLTDGAIVWATSAPATASVSATGLVTALAAGTANITATNGEVSGSITIVVTASSVGSITVSYFGAGLLTTTLLLNGQVQAFAVVRDSAGGLVTSIQPVWTSSLPTRVTVSPSGLIKQVAGGPLATVSISASAGGLTATAVVQAMGHAPENAPAPPRVVLNTAAPAAPDVGGVVLTVPRGGNLQGALDAALPGDVVELAAGATFTGTFTLKNKGATSKWITIRPTNFASLPAQGSRMTPAIAASLRLPRIETASTAFAIQFAAGANHYRITGIEVGIKAGTPLTYALINTESITGQTSLLQVPSNIVIDRVYAHGSPTQTVRRCVALNSASSAVIDSYLSDCHELGSDSQAIAIWNGPGPFKIVNNYLEAAGENILVGGGDPSIANLVPSDIEIRRNHFFKQPSWKGVWTVKNLLELKNAQRVLIEGNVLQNSWTNAQNGLGVMFKSVNQNGSCHWCITQDVTYRRNVLQNVGAGYNIGASPDNAYPTVHARRIAIIDNIATNINTSAQFDGDGRAFLIDGDLRDVLIAHNTTMTETHAMVFGGAPTVSFTARDNVFGSRLYAVLGTGYNGGAAFAAFAPTGYLLQNLFIGEPDLSSVNFGKMHGSGGYPTTTSFESGSGNPNVGFANVAGGDYSLLSSSAYKRQGTDGADLGANVAAVTAATAGVIIP